MPAAGIASTSNIDFPERRWWVTSTTGPLDSLGLGTQRVKFGYNADGLHTTTTWGTGGTSITRTMGYSAEHRPASVGFNVGALDGAFQQTFGSDSQGRINVTSRFTPGVGFNGADRTTARRYQYDGVGRLTRIQHDQTDTGQECWYEGMFEVCEPFSITSVTRRLGMAYDAASNLTQEADSVSGTTVVAGYQWGNRLDSLGQAHFAHDHDGNLTSRTTPTGTTPFGWDGSGQLRWAASGSDTTYFDYDAAGQLVRRRKSNGVTQRWLLWDQGQLMAELDSTASDRVVEYAYYPGADQPLAMITGGTGASVVHWVQQTVTGNVEGVFSTGGTLEQTLRYDEWGVLEGSSSTIGVLTGLRWKGLYYEDGPARLYYMRARWYDPTARRFVSEDPIGLAGGINPFAFGGDDPVNMSDPSGLCPPAPCVRQLPRVRITARPWQPPAPWTGGYEYDGSPDYNSLVTWTSDELNLMRRMEEVAQGGQSNVYAIPYQPAAACPAFLRPGTPFRRRLESMGSMRSGAREAQAYFSAGGREGVRRSNITYGTNTGVTNIPAPPAGANASGHSHPPPYGSAPQGLSNTDSTRAASLSLPEFAISRDSIYWVNPDGRAYGCAR